MSEAPKGHVKVARRTFDPVTGDPLWLEQRVFSRWEAWVDVIQMAAHGAHARVTQFGRVALRRGEFVASLRWMADRWKWTVKKVRVWLAALEKAGRIRAQREEAAGQVYLIVTYDDEQCADDPVKAFRAQRAQERAQVGAHEGAQGRPAQSLDAAAVSLTDTPPKGTAKGTERAQERAQERSSKALDGKSIKAVESSGAVAPKLEIVAHSWPAEGAALWVETVGRMSAGRFGKVLKPFVDTHGWPAVRIALVRWIVERQAAHQPPKLEWFADVATSEIHRPAQEIVDEFGVLTEYGKRVTAIA